MMCGIEKVIIVAIDVSKVTRTTTLSMDSFRYILSRRFFWDFIQF
jgi:hypothetical protein